jgi:hypothetical protein
MFLYIDDMLYQKGVFQNIISFMYNNNNNNNNNNNKCDKSTINNLFRLRNN